jgi:hypothetical protein
VTARVVVAGAAGGLGEEVVHLEELKKKDDEGGWGKAGPVVMVVDGAGGGRGRRDRGSAAAPDPSAEALENPSSLPTRHAASRPQSAWLFACVHLCLTNLPSPVFSLLFFFFFPFLLGRNDVAEET